MEAKNEATSRSLPPLVEGKIHGYLRLVIDEIVWCRRSPGDVTVLASWWGELDSAQFRPADIKSGDNRLDHDITETYTIRTNLELFEEYLKNCETVELVVISEKTHQVVGTAQVPELYNLLSGKSYFQYIPILNDSGSRIGDIHVTMKLLNLPRSQKSPSKTEVLKKKKQGIKILPDDTNIFQDYSSYRSETRGSTKTSFLYENDIPVAIKNAKQNENIYRSILKERRLDSANSLAGVNDKLVAQVVARAQRLRGAILKEARDEDPLALSEGSTIDSPSSDRSVDKETALYEYFLGKKMTRSEEKKALEALRSTSPTPSLMDLAAETIRTCRDEKKPPTSVERIPLTKSSKTVEELSPPDSGSLQQRELAPIDYVDSLRIAVESLSLSPAGYRRVRSSCLSRGDGVPVSVTYFVQYDAMFGSLKKFNRKIINESKPVKLCSKKQVGQVVYFNHDAVYDLPKTYLHMDMPLKFKIFNRHLNQRTPTELGVGSMYVGDAARSPSLSSTQRLAVVNKGIKIGELKVTAELGCDKIHFGKQFVEAVTSAKENIPVLEVSSNSSLATERYRTATGNEDKTSSGKPSSSGGNQGESSWSGNNSARTSKQESRQRRLQQNAAGDREEEPRCDLSEKVLLHGLIYVAEGKDLSSTSTYLICRAFWREDRAASRICDDTNNPFYHFHQLVPLIHGPDLLERTKDNCIVIEVYSRNSNGVDSLLGISKLPVHQLYVAYRDPQVLPHLLRSKYPVISVDGWVSIADPVTGRPCGQILALVALGTADQIALLEMTRGLRDSSVTSRTVRTFAWNATEVSNSMGNQRDGRHVENEAQLVRETRQGSYEAAQDSRRANEDHYGLETFLCDPERAAADDRSVKTQECQTEITTVKYFKPHRAEEEPLASENPQSQVLNAIVDRLAQALNVPKPSADQSAQTETDFRTRNSDNKETKIREIEPLNLGPSTNNSFSEDSDGSQRGDFHLSTEIYRSVGVGAEFDDAGNQGPSTSYATVDSTSVPGFGGRIQATNLHTTNLQDRQATTLNPAVAGFNDRPTTTISSPRLPSTRNDGPDSEPFDAENSAFRAVVEIECALHLPKVERPDDAVEPCTYVTFQKARNGGETQYGSYVVTNLCPFSCSPKWDWRCDTKLSNDLLENEEKRLILKVWRLVDPETSMQIDLERDIVIGFSAIDVSVLTVGFPVVSGWFHVMDFTGKCNGQIKVSVTPLDNITLGKSTCVSTIARPPLPDFDHSNFSSPYPADLQNNANPGGSLNSARRNVEEVATSRSQVDNEPMLDIGLGLGDASMSFLSLSLKQKLTELDEIKKRLQSRLHDVTNTAFDDDFDNDFDMPIVESDRDNLENGNSTEDSRNVLREMESWQIPQVVPENLNSRERCTMTNGNRCHFDAENRRVASNSNSVSLDANFTDTGYSTSSNVQSSHNASNGNRFYSETEDNRFRSRLLSEENVNGFETGSGFPVSPNLVNGHYETHETNAKNRTDVLNVRNYRAADHVLDFRGQSAGNAGTDDLSNDSEEQQPIRGTRMHISHLLDKLTTQLTTVPAPPTTNQPMKRNIMDLISSLRRNNNNFPNDVKCNREVNVRTVPTQTETNYVRDSRVSHLSNNSTETRESAISNDQEGERDDAEVPAKTKRRNKVSTVIREELAAAEESNETQDCDELSAHLMTSNVRHMNLESILNPLLYTHLIPDVQTMENDDARTGNSPHSPRNTPEVEAIERLDTRYTENFNATINNGLSRLRNLIDAESSSRQERSVGTSSENDQVFRMTPSGLSENIDGNIDVTVIHKPCNDDLMASNSVESTTTISLEHDLHTGTEIDDNSSLNSSETSVSAVSRQAPDGGNPVEESAVPLIRKRSDDSQDSSSGS